MNPRIRACRVRALVQLLGEARERARGGDEVFSNFGRAISQLLGADVAIVALGSRPDGGETTLVDLKPSGLSPSVAEQARRVYLDRGFTNNLAAAKVLEPKGHDTFTVKRRRELVDDDAWYHSEFVDKYRRAWGLDDAIYGSHLTADGRLIAFGSCRTWGARPFTEEDCALARIFWEECAAELATPESPLSRRQRDTLRLLLEGHSAKAIASTLDLSIYTVKEYIRAVYQARNVHSRAELMALATTRFTAPDRLGGSSARPPPAALSPSPRACAPRRDTRLR
jgi:DNA-binding CsgD family transcriptional regulator